MRIFKLANYAGDKPLHPVLRQTYKPIKLHGHDFHELMHILHGSGSQVLNGRRLELRPGQTWYIGTEDWHAIQPARTGMTWINVAFHDPAWQGFKALTGLIQPERVMEGRSRDPFDFALEAYLNDNSPWALATFLVAALKPSSAAPAVPDWLSKAVAGLDEPENLRGGVGALRDLACVSPSYLTRATKAKFGMTPTDLVNKKRLEYAQLLLASGSLKIADVASQCGFESLSYFFRVFHREFGMTPLEYRRSKSIP